MTTSGMIFLRVITRLTFIKTARSCNSSLVRIDKLDFRQVEITILLVTQNTWLALCRARHNQRNNTYSSHRCCFSGLRRTAGSTMPYYIGAPSFCKWHSVQLTANGARYKNSYYLPPASVTLASL